MVGFLPLVTYTDNELNSVVNIRDSIILKLIIITNWSDWLLWWRVNWCTTPLNELITSMIDHSSWPLVHDTKKQ